MIIIQKEWYSVEQCNANPRNLYVFGDNVQRVGKGGQAQIRACQNSFGIATKNTPSMHNTAFFYDAVSYLEIIDRDIDILLKLMPNWDNIIFPYDGLGTGLSKLAEKAPLINRILKDTLLIKFGVKYP